MCFISFASARNFSALRCDYAVGIVSCGSVSIGLRIDPSYCLGEECYPGRRSTSCHRPISSRGQLGGGLWAERSAHHTQRRPQPRAKLRGCANAFFVLPFRPAMRGPHLGSLCRHAEQWNAISALPTGLREAGRVLYLVSRGRKDISAWSIRNNTIRLGSTSSTREANKTSGLLQSSPTVSTVGVPGLLGAGWWCAMIHHRSCGTLWRVQSRSKKLSIKAPAPATVNSLAPKRYTSLPESRRSRSAAAISA